MVNLQKKKKNGKIPESVSIGEYCERMFIKEYYAQIKQSPLADDFDVRFNPREFTVSRAVPPKQALSSDIYCLRYIGGETDGSRIHIPDGIKHCDYMFSRYGKYAMMLDTPPVIPDSVETCDGMFYMCSSLKEPAAIPDSVKSCNRMYAYCTNLTSLPDVPDSVVNRDDMFLNCWRAGFESKKPSGKDRSCENLGISEESVESDVDYQP